MIRAASGAVSSNTQGRLAGRLARDWRPLRAALGAIACAMLGLLALTPRTARAQITIVAGNGQSASINTAVATPLVVSIDCSSVTAIPIPSPCGTVSWTSSEPGDSFSPQLSFTSGPGTAATSSTVVTLGSTPGARIVTATSGLPLPGSTSVTFTISGNPAASSTTTQVVQATTGAKQAATLGPTAVITTGIQTANIGLRLQALRQGVRGVSLSGLSLKFAGESMALGAVTSLFPSVERSGGASADRSGILSRLGVFVNGQGSFGNQDATSRETGFDFHTAGTTLGADYRFTDRFILGLAFGYLRTRSNLDSSAGDSTTNGYSLSAYTNYYISEKLYIDGIATFGGNTYDTERNIPGANATAKGGTDGTQFSFSVGSGYNLNVGALTFGPTGRVNYVRVHVDGYRERGADPFNLSIGSQTVESLTTDLGGQAMYAISMQWGVLTPFVRFEWEHEYKGNSRAVTASLGPTVVTVQTDNPDRDYLNLGAGLSATFKAGMSAFLDYEVVLGRTNFTSHSFTAGVRFEF